MPPLPCRMNPSGGAGTPLEYLQADGNQWIDTGIKPSDFDYLEIKFSVEHAVAGVENSLA